MSGSARPPGRSRSDTSPGGTELQLREAEARFQTFFESAPIGEAIVAPDGRFLAVNPALCEIVGYSEDELLAMSFQQLTHPDDVAADVDAARRMNSGESRSYHVEKRYIHALGHVVWALLSVTVMRLDDGTPRYFVSQVQDISERKRAEEERSRLRDELHHAQKLEAVGRLAGGVAHDFNNLLTAIRGYCELLLAQLEPGTSQHHDAEQIHRAAEQASALPTQLLAFSRRQALEPRVVDLDALVSNTADLLSRLIGEAIELRIVPAQVEAFAHVDPGRVEQALVDLALNARDAMPSGGTLTISTARVETKDETDDGAARHGVDTGPSVVISVVDTGIGMDADTRARVFEPFYTTKPQGEGSGLGLASVYGTVSQSGGFITIESELGKGSTFRVHLPAVEAAPRPQELTETPPAAPLPHLAEDEDPVGALPGVQPASPAAPVVLLAEDEDLVRELARSVLEQAGFDVRAAIDGSDALGVLQNLDRPIDVLVTDIVMPIVDGIELAVWVERSQPGTPVVFISGYADDSAAFEADERGESRLLPKPFSTRALVQAVRDAHVRGRLPAPSPAPESVTKDSPPPDLVDAQGA